MAFKKLSIAVGICLVVSGGSSVFAKSQDMNEPTITHETIGDLEIVEKVWNTPVNYDYEDALEEDKESKYTPKGISPQYVDFNETVYEISKKDLYKAKSFETEVTNRGSANDSVTRSVSRKTFVTGKVGTSGETAVNWKLIQGKVGINAEVAFGKETVETTTYTWTIPANTVTTIEYGSKAVSTSGSIVKYFHGEPKKTTYVYTDYSYSEYADKNPKKLR
ncbi:hypothetical protein GOP56_07805 [Brevibacillus sp. 7WMA2]|uniref:hypothetical protein n=1 Tax=Brevibacillus TaxID=55080 RepID=UPI0013A7A76B|nr:MULTISPECIES: hypothetical protein [Brevibacillus]MCR8997826.1 hypothetical protein [Brevibacillus laterosporus]QIC05502.1 hypothetical protein GOP56_07805 [Brevibacillus sp. 7WMA2]WPS86343.1 hypothetical protein SMD22_17750 [Brevibacillus halotolerans]